MKRTKRIWALLLSVVLTLSLLPTTVFAAGTDYTTRLLIDKVSEDKVDVKWMLQTANDANVVTVLNILFKYDNTKYELLDNDGGVIDLTGKTMSNNLCDSVQDEDEEQNVTAFTGGTFWNNSGIYAQAKGDYTFVLMQLMSSKSGSRQYTTEEQLAVVHLKLKSGVAINELPSGSIALASKTEANDCAQSGILVYNARETEGSSAVAYIYGATDEGVVDTLPAPAIVAGEGVSFAKSALPTGAAANIAYSNGTPVRYEQTLTASLSGVTDPGALTYKWYRTKDGTTTQIEGATDSSYKLAVADIGCTIKVEISAANYSGSVTSDNTPAITKGNGPYPVEPDKEDITATHNSITITGGTKVGQQYNVSTKVPGGDNTPTDGWQSPSANGDSLTFTGLQSQKQYYILVRRPETDVYLEGMAFYNKITTLKAPIGTVSATVEAPVKGELLATGVTVPTDAKYSGTVAWYEGNNADGTAVTGNAKVNTVYTAKITLTAKSGESFDSSGVTVTLNGAALTGTYTPGTDGNLVVTKTFERTADKDALPDDATLSYYFASTTAASSGSADGKYGDLLHVEVTGLPDDCGKVTIKFDAIEGETSTSLGSIETNEITDHSVKKYRSLAMSADEIGKKLNITVTCENYSGSLTAQTPVIQKAPQTSSPHMPQVTNNYDYTTNKPVIQVSIAEGTQWALIEGTAVPDADTVWVDYPSSGMMVDGKRQYTFADLKPDTSYKVYARYAETATHLVGTNYGSVTVKTLVAAITDVSGVSVAAPVKGEALATGITGGDATKYSGTVEWYEGDNADGTAVTDVNAKANTVYTAKITLTADRTASTAADRQHFADNSFITVPSGYTLSDNNHWVIVLTKTFPATLEKTLSSITLVPTTSLPVPTKEAYNLYGENSGNCSITATYDDGSTDSGSDITTGVTWEILTTPHTGVTLNGDGSGIARFAVDNTASWTPITIRATYGGKSAEATISPVKAASELTSMTINGAETIAVPKAGEETKKETYSLSCEDQYGADMTTPTGVTWSCTGLTPATAGENAEFDDATRTLIVPNTAAANDVTITATYGSGTSTVTATKSVKITREASVPTTVTINGADEVTIPAVKDDMTPGSATASYTATVKDQYGQDMLNQSVTWSVSASDASISDSGVLTVTSSTAQNTGNKVTATVTGTTVSGEKTVKLMRISPYVPKFVKIFKNGTEVTTDSIVIPGGEDINSASYTAKVYNQYGEEYEYSLSWSLTDATGVMLNDESSPVQVKVASNASEGTLTLEAKATDTVKATVSISLVDKLSATVAIDRSNATDVTYGTDFTLSATATDADGHALTGGTWTWSSGDASVLEITGGANTDTVTISPKKAYNNSTTPVVITATYENDTHSGSTTTGFTLVNQRVITVGAGTAKVSKVYDGTTSVSFSNVTGEVSIDRTNVLTADNEASKLSVAYTYADYTSKDVHTGSVVFTFGLQETAAANYKLSTTTVSVPCEITKKAISVSGAAVSDKDYDGNRDATVTGVTFTGLVTGETLEKGTDYEVVSAAFPDADADASNVNVTVTVQLKDTDKANNYSLSSGSYTAANAAKINKADYTGTPSVTKDIVKNSAAVQSGTLTAADFFTTAPAGAKITEIATSDTSLDVVSNISVADDGTLSYASKTGITAAEGDTYSITISSTNYKDIHATLKFRLVDKADAGVAIADDTASTTYGTNITITATKTTDKTGSWSWVYDPDYFEPVGATNGASVTLKPLKATLNSGTTVTAKYEGNDVVGSDEISVTINKATLTVTAKDQSIQVGAEAPDLSSPVAGTHYTVSGLVNGDDLDVEMKYQKDGSDATPNTSAAGSYEIVIAADADTSKYTINTVDGTLTIANRPAPPAASGKYRITVLDTVNGKAEADQRSAKAGETITVTVDPDAGYTVEDITILDRNGDKVKFRLKGGKYVFEMPASSVTVQVDFERSENPFVDVPEGKYFYDAVLWALDNGITGGTDATHFSPYASCTRGQLVTFLWRAIGEPAAKKGNTFSDVEKGRYCEKAVSWAAENEIVGGYDDGTFRPDATVTRQQTAAILWRFAKYAGMDVSVGEDTNILSYNDALTISDYAFPAIQWAVGAGIMGGNDGDLLPRGTCTRAQIVTMLYRCLAK